MNQPVPNFWPKAALQFLAYLATSMALNLALDAFTQIHGWKAAGIGAFVAAVLWLTIAPIVAPRWFPFPRPRKTP